MEKIKSTVPLLYDSRHKRSSFIEIQIDKFSELNNGGYVADVTDYYYKDAVIVNGEGENETIQQRLVWWSRPIPFTSQQVAQLSAMIAPLITVNTDEPTRRKILKQQALLYYVQNDFIDEEQTRCVYDTLPNVWEIVQ